jgi:hypothetical protein
MPVDHLPRRPRRHLPHSRDGDRHRTVAEPTGRHRGVAGLEPHGILETVAQGRRLEIEGEHDGDVDALDRGLRHALIMRASATGVYSWERSQSRNPWRACPPRAHSVQPPKAQEAGTHSILNS